MSQRSGAEASGRRVARLQGLRKQVSPVAKNGNDAGVGVATNSTFVASSEGESVAYETLGVFPGAQGAYDDQRERQSTRTERMDDASRGPSAGASPERRLPRLPVLHAGPGVLGRPQPAELQPGAGRHARRREPLPPGQRHRGLYDVEQPASIRSGPPGRHDQLRIRRGERRSPDLLFTSSDPLTPDSPPYTQSTTNVYESVEGRIRLVTILPDETPSSLGGAPGGPSGASSFTTMSADGSRIIFGTPVGSPGDDAQIYERVDGTRTVEVSASQRTVTDPTGPAPPRFWAASRDGTLIYFSSQLALTDDATIGVTSLYRYDVISGRLTDITVDADPTAPPGGGLMGVRGISDDGSYVYFNDTRQLVAGKGVQDDWNLYVWHDDHVSFVAADEPSNTADFEALHKTGRVTPDGTRLIFTSTRSLTGYDNTDAQTGQPDREVFLYDATVDRLTCVSCNPSGQQPVGSATLPEPPLRPVPNLQRGVSDDGRRVFFDTRDALLPADVNGKEDVDQYEDGAVHGLRLVSSEDDSFFGSASSMGTTSSLPRGRPSVATDQDDNLDVYDARVGGGFVVPPSREPCLGDACQGVPTPLALLPAPVSQTVVGDGNAPSGPSPKATFSVRTPSSSVRRSAARNGTLPLLVKLSEGGIVQERPTRRSGTRTVSAGSVDQHVARASTVTVKLRLAKSDPKRARSWLERPAGRADQRDACEEGQDDDVGAQAMSAAGREISMMTHTTPRGTFMKAWILAIAVLSAVLAYGVPSAGAAARITSFGYSVTNADGTPSIQAGAHPYQVATTLTFPSHDDGQGHILPDESPRNLTVKLPAGFVGHLTAVPTCSEQRLETQRFAQSRPRWDTRP